jgi:hypothetical protein
MVLAPERLQVPKLLVSVDSNDSDDATPVSGTKYGGTACVDGRALRLLHERLVGRHGRLAALRIHMADCDRAPCARSVCHRHPTSYMIHRLVVLKIFVRTRHLMFSV